MKNITYLILIIVFAQILSSCATKIQYVPLVETKIEYIDKYHRDSIYLRDSIFINQYRDNDTVRIYEYRNNYIYRDVVRIDSIIQVDSIPFPVEIQVDKIIYKRTFFDTLQIYALYLLIPILGILYLLKRFKII